ncbi:hypothetical protein [Saccharopolyspora sp. NPDC002376]
MPLVLMDGVPQRFAGPRVPWRFVFEWLVEWYDGVELWLVQLPYPLQVVLVFSVLLPLCWGLARVIDRGIDGLGAKLTRVRDAEPPVGRRDDESSRGRKETA